jgi:hypothetical protein
MATVTTNDDLSDDAPAVDDLQCFECASIVTTQQRRLAMLVSLFGVWVCGLGLAAGTLGTLFLRRPFQWIELGLCVGGVILSLCLTRLIQLRFGQADGRRIIVDLKQKLLIFENCSVHRGALSIGLPQGEVSLSFDDIANIERMTGRGRHFRVYFGNQFIHIDNDLSNVDRLYDTLQGRCEQSATGTSKTRDSWRDLVKFLVPFAVVALIVAVSCWFGWI